MRFVPVLVAIIVALVLYGIVVERERLQDFAQDVLPPALTGSDQADVDATAEVEATDTAPEAPVAELPAGTVRVIALKSVATEIDSAITLRGETEAARQVNVQSETTGTVISEPLRRGAFVQAGQALCELDPGTRPAALAEAKARLAEAMARRPEVEARIPEAEARVAEARALLAEAQINANAADKLSADGFASESRVKATFAGLRSAEARVSSAEAGLKSASSGTDSLQASIESAQAAVERAETELNRLTITAPFAGLLETDTAELGALLSASAPSGAHCATVIQLDPIKLVGYVPETAVSRIEVGALGGARLSDGSNVRGRVTFLSRSADPATRTFRVEIAVPNGDLKIRDGQTAEIAIESDGVRAHLLPASALTLSDEGVLGVRTIAPDDTALFKKVTLMRDTREGVWVAGLPEEETIIIVGQEFVTDGVSVAPSFEDVIQ